MISNFNNNNMNNFINMNNNFNNTSNIMYNFNNVNNKNVLNNINNLMLLNIMNNFNNINTPILMNNMNYFNNMNNLMLMNNMSNINNYNGIQMNKKILQEEFNNLYLNGIPYIGDIIKDLNKRGIREWNLDIKKFDLNSKIDIGFSLSLINNNLYEWKFTLKAPKDSLYSGGFFYLKAIFPKEYPKERPEICFITPIYHPLVCNRGGFGLKLGGMCISLLNFWNMKTKIVEVIANIYGLFYYFEPCCPIAGLDISNLLIENFSLFKKRIKYFIKKYASIPIYKEYSEWDFSYPEKY